MLKKVLTIIFIILLIFCVVCNISYGAKTLDDLYTEAIEETKKTGANKTAIENWQRQVDAITREQVKEYLKADGVKNPTDLQIAQKKLELLESVKSNYEKNINKNASGNKKLCAYLDAYFENEKKVINDEIKSYSSETPSTNPNETELERAKREFQSKFKEWESKYKNKDFSKMTLAEQQKMKREIQNIDEYLLERYNIIKNNGGQDEERTVTIIMIITIL